MKIKFDPEQLGTVYAFLGGLTYIQGLERAKRRNLARIANRFGNNLSGHVYLNSTRWDYVYTLLLNAVTASSKAIADGKVKPEDIENNNKTNQVFTSVIDKINKAYKSKLKGKNTDLSKILGKPPISNKNNQEGETVNESN